MKIRRHAIFLLLPLCGKQSNVFDRSVSNAVYSPPRSSIFLTFLSLPLENFVD